MRKLISVLHSEDACFYIHVDKKVNVNAFIKEVNQLGLTNVSFIPSQKIFWGTISQTEARIRMIRKAFGSTQKFSHFVMLSGQTYPIKPVKEFMSFLENNVDVSFMEHYPLPYFGIGENGGMERINCYSFSFFGNLTTYLPSGYYNTFNFKGRTINAFLSIITFFRKKRKFPSYISAYYGIDWWVLSNSAAKYLIDFVDNHLDYHKYHKYTRHTCEIYFPSIIAGSKFQGKVINDSLHYMQWLANGSGNTRVFMKKDIDELKNNKAFFARKFDLGDDVLDIIDRELLKI